MSEVEVMEILDTLKEKIEEEIENPILRAGIDFTDSEYDRFYVAFSIIYYTYYKFLNHVDRVNLEIIKENRVSKEYVSSIIFVYPKLGNDITNLLNFISGGFPKLKKEDENLFFSKLENVFKLFSMGQVYETQIFFCLYQFLFNNLEFINLKACIEIYTPKTSCVYQDLKDSLLCCKTRR